MGDITKKIKENRILFVITIVASIAIINKLQKTLSSSEVSTNVTKNSFNRGTSSVTKQKVAKQVYKKRLIVINQHHRCSLL